MRVFLSHASPDKARVVELDAALRARGIDTWFDKWEIHSGDDFVAKINEGLDACDAGIVVLSHHTAKSGWVTAEVSALIHASIEDGKLLLPISLDDDAPVPGLLRPRLRRGIDEHDAIVEALLGRHASPPPTRRAGEGRVEKVIVRLGKETVRLGREEEAIHVAVHAGDALLGEARFEEIPADVLTGYERFREGFRIGSRDPLAADRSRREAQINELGHALRPFCLPGDASEAVTELVDGAPVGTTVEIAFESDRPELLDLPFDALRLEDGRLLSIAPNVVTMCRDRAGSMPPIEKLAGPLKILVAVGAPDEDKSSTVVLDQERELQNILDAVEGARRRENVEVRILEVGSPGQIGAAFERDAYHVLHLSCHGRPGMLELENEDGEPERVTATELLAPIKKTGRLVPLVFLNCCHGAVNDGDTASLASELLRAGVPSVLAMQTAVSDHYASQLARAFYQHLAARDTPRPTRALAAARRELELARRQAIAQGQANPVATQPEAATATLFLTGDDAVLMNPSLDGVPLQSPPVYEVSGPVPQLRIDDLIGRRKELRETLGIFRDPSRQVAGVALTGIGGVGKSAVAGRVMQRLKEDAWIVT
ncbi:MAG: CHAT domain-containing protein, partial [Acidobacteriota bacterium]